MDKNHNVGLLLALSFLLHISYLYMQALLMRLMKLLHKSW